MSVVLTNQFNRSENIAAANKAAAIQREAAKSGMPPDPTTLPPQVLQRDFMEHVTHDLSHAYAVVFVVAVCLVALTYIPASFLPKKPAPRPSSEPIGPVLAH
jgi:MFS transporter, DHA2 family, multidrug resistance protein